MIAKNGEDRDILCDNCGELACDGIPGLSFQEALTIAKDAGFSVRQQPNGEWLHLCPLCRDDGIHAQRRLLGM